MNRMRAIARVGAFDGYWPITEFVSVLHPAPSKHKAIAMLVGYFDETGIGGRDKVVMVAGAVTDSVEWSRLELPWRAYLRQHQKRVYHAVDCEHGEGEFERTDRPLREALTYALSKELSRIPLQGFASGVVRGDWVYASAAAKTRARDDPYYLAFELCLQQISAWSKKCADGEPVALVFAKQEQYEPRELVLHEFYQRAKQFGIEGIGSLTFCSPKLLVQLQAADMLWYEVHRRFAESSTGNPETSRIAFKNLEEAGNMSLSCMIHDRLSLSALQWKRPTVGEAPS